MDAEEFRRRGKEMIDYIGDYLENIRNRRPYPNVQPGYIRDLIPNHAPDEAERWDYVFEDIERVIMPGCAHYQHPNFHAYTPLTNSYPSILADMLSDSICCAGCTWATSPACTELEMVMMDWLGKMLNLPSQFLFCSGGAGGGVIQGTACEATLMALLSARVREIKKYKEQHVGTEDGVIISKFVAYCSDQAHSSVEKAGLIACVKMRSLMTDDDAALQADVLKRAIDEDKAQGRIPIFLCATLGTTPSCAFDNAVELGKVCEKEGLWMHIDAAYAGSAFICPEYRYLLNGVEYAESFNFNPHKWLKVNFDCSAMWVRESRLISEAFRVDPLYLKHENQDQMPDYRHWQIPLVRRFRSLKLWFVMRMYGQNGLQESIRKDIELAKEFEQLVQADPRFEIIGKVTMGMVCFRVKNASNEFNQGLLKAINKDCRIHITPAEIRNTYFLRFVICASRTTSSDVKCAWGVITEQTDTLMQRK